MEPSADVRARAGDRVVVRQVHDRCVLVNLKTGNCWELNRLGFEVWTLLEQGLTTQAVCAELARRYDVSPEVVTQDVRDLLEVLTREGLVEVSPAQPSPR